MTRLPRSKKTSQVSFTAHRFNPATCTDRVITIENRSGFKHLRKLELTREDRETIEKMRWRAKNLDPEVVESIVKTEGVKKSSVVLFRAQHKASWWSNSSKLWVWHQKRHKDGRWFTGGIAKLMDMTGLSEMTVKRGLAELKAIGVIFERAHGRKGVTNTIWELALDKRHVNAEKRKPKKPKK